MKPTIFLGSLFVLLVLAACKGESPIDSAYDNPGSKTPVSSKVYFEAEFDGTAWKADFVQASQNVLGGTGSLVIGAETEGRVDNIGITMTSTSRIVAGSYTLGTVSPTVQIAITVGRESNSRAYSLYGTGALGTLVLSDVSGSTLEGTITATLKNPLNPTDSLVITNGRFKTDNYREF
ncbi:MAG: hypothetical protein OHK0039_05830 [Bacteroidia bacterium]